MIDHKTIVSEVQRMDDLLLHTAANGWTNERPQCYPGGLRAADVQPGDRVALLMENVEYFAAYFAVFLCGAIAVPLDVKAQTLVIPKILDESAVGALVVTQQAQMRLASSVLRAAARLAA